MTRMDEHSTPEHGGSRPEGRGSGPITICGHSLGEAAICLGPAAVLVMLAIFGTPW